MSKFCMINEETKEIAQIDGEDVIASHPQLLSLSRIYHLVDGERFDTITEYPVVDMAYPYRKGIYIVALNKNEGGRGLLVGMNNKFLHLFLGYWNGEFFNINGVDYHCLNVHSWTFVMDDRQTSEFFNVWNKGRK